MLFLELYYFCTSCKLNSIGANRVSSLKARWLWVRKTGKQGAIYTGNGTSVFHFNLL